MNSKALKIQNLPSDRNVEYRLDAKSNAILWCIIVVGVVLCFKAQYVYFGLFFIIGGVYALVFLPKRILLEFCPEYVIVYNRVNRDDCVLVYYDEIISWEYITGNTRDWVLFELEEGESVGVPAFAKTRTRNYLRHYVANKEKKSA